MGTWLIYALLSVVSLAIYKTTIKFISLDVSSILIMTVTSFFYFLLWVIIFFSAHYTKGVSLQLKPSQYILIGILSIAFFVSDYFLVRSYIGGAKLSVMTILMGLSMLITVLIGLFFFKEKLNMYQVFGIIFGLISFALLTLSDKSV